MRSALQLCLKTTGGEGAPNSLSHQFLSKLPAQRSASFLSSN